MVAKILDFQSQAMRDKIDAAVAFIVPLAKAIKAAEDACSHEWADWEVDPTWVFGGDNPQTFDDWRVRKGMSSPEVYRVHENILADLKTPMQRMCDVCGKLEERAPETGMERAQVRLAFSAVIQKWNPVFRRFGIPQVGLREIFAREQT